MVAAHLMAQSTRAGVDHGAHLTFPESERRRGRFVLDALDHLQFEEMVPAPERAERLRTPFHRPLAESTSPLQLAVGFDGRKVLVESQPEVRRRLRTLIDHLLQVPLPESGSALR